MAFRHSAKPALGRSRLYAIVDTTARTANRCLHSLCCRRRCSSSLSRLLVKKKNKTTLVTPSLLLSLTSATQLQEREAKTRTQPKHPRGRTPTTNGNPELSPIGFPPKIPHQHAPTRMKNSKHQGEKPQPTAVSSLSPPFFLTFCFVTLLSATMSAHP